MAPGVCHQCGSTDVEYNDARGESTCTNCGAVLSEGAMVDNPQFVESSGGIMHLSGAFVSATTGMQAYGNRQSRELTLQRGYGHIQRIADYLGLQLRPVEMAQRVYHMAQSRGFTAGRSTRYVAAACLYIASRRIGAPQMLIDFSDILRVPVRTLGQVFMKLVRLLSMKVPPCDPSLFMERFAWRLDLDGKTMDVAATGVRLIQAMARDWICTGRRPTGLCGAALLIAARFHGFSITAVDVASIVRISQPTIVKRLYEFRQTSTARITGRDFEGTDLLSLPILRGPPCLEARRAKEQALALRDREATLALEDGGETADEVQAGKGASRSRRRDKKKKRRLEGRRERKKRKKLKALTGAATDTAGEGDAEEVEDADETGCDEEVVENALQVLGGMQRSSAFLGKVPLSNYTQKLACDQNPTSENIAAIASDMVSAIGTQLMETQTTVAETQELEASGEEAREDKSVQEDPNDDDPLGLLLAGVADKADEILAEMVDAVSPQPDTPTASNLALAIPEEGEDDDEREFFNEETLSDVDDAEIADMLLDEEQKMAKALIWDELTKSVMPLVHRRYRDRMRRERIQQGLNYKKRKTTKKQPLPPAATAVDSVRIALDHSGRSIANRINDDVLASLFPFSNGTAKESPVSPTKNGSREAIDDFFA